MLIFLYLIFSTFRKTVGGRISTEFNRMATEGATKKIKGKETKKTKYSRKETCRYV